MIRTVFFGTPDFAATCLAGLWSAPHVDVVGVVSAPDRPSGRGQQLRSSPVADLAKSYGIPLLQPERLRDPVFLAELDSLKADVFTVVAFRMLPEVVWNMPPLGSLNIHGSLLPDLRGAAPIQWSLAYGDRQTGLTAFLLNHHIDEGPLLDSVQFTVGSDETFGTLYGRMASAGAQLAAEVLGKIVRNELHPRPQILQGTERPAPKIHADFADLARLTGTARVHDRIRACDPLPGAFVTNPEDPNSRVKFFGSRWTKHVAVNQIGCVTYVIDNHSIKLIGPDGTAEISEVQWPGKRRMPVADFLRGSRLRGHFTLTGQKID